MSILTRLWLDLGEEAKSTTKFEKITVLAMLKNLNLLFFKNSNANLTTNLENNTQNQNFKEKLILQECSCCGVVIKVFDHAVNYKCNYCKAFIKLPEPIKYKNSKHINHLSFELNNLLEETKVMNLPKSLNISDNIYLSLNNLRECIDSLDYVLKDYSSITKYIDSYFTYKSLKRSFISDTKSIDYAHLNLFYTEIWGSQNKNRELQKISLKILLKFYDILTKPKCIIDYDFLRCVLIIIECPAIKSWFKPLYSNSAGKKFNKKSNYYIKINFISFQILTKALSYLGNGKSHYKELLAKNIYLKFSANELDDHIIITNTYINYSLYKLLLKQRSQLNEKNKTFCKYNSDEYLLFNKFVQYSSNSSSNKISPSSAITFKSYNNNIILLNAFEYLKFLYQISCKNYLFDDISVFYNVIIDFVDLKLDLNEWSKKLKPNRKKKKKLFICDYPFAISFGQKENLLQLHFKKIMNFKLEEVFIKSLNQKKVEALYFYLRVDRRSVWLDTVKSIKNEILIYNYLEGIIDDLPELSKFTEFSRTPSLNLHKSLKIEFIKELGLDASGLRREWFYQISKEIFSSKNGFFINLENRNTWFPLDEQNNKILAASTDYYFIFGMIFGLSFFNFVQGHLGFPVTFYKKLYNTQLNVKDFQDVYPVQYKFLMSLINLTPEELKSMDLRFEINILVEKINEKSEKENCKNDMKIVESKTIQLIENGSKTVVTTTNRNLFIKSYINYYLNTGIKKSYTRFCKGYGLIINDKLPAHFLSHWEMYKMYNNGITTWNDIDLSESHDPRYALISSSEIDLLAAVTRYVNCGKTSSDWKLGKSQTIDWFWEIVKEETKNDISKRKNFDFCFLPALLRFTTGIPGIPLGGLQVLEFKLSSIYTYSGKTTPLPVAHTCFNELVLCNTYNSKQCLRNALVTSIEHTDDGFYVR
ncbi:hypothetical protein QEN19_001341 [Hanseniaspora menglaensis]